MYTTELCNLLRESDYLIWYCSALDDLKTCNKKRNCSSNLTDTLAQVVDNDTNEIIWQQQIDTDTDLNLIKDISYQMINAYTGGMLELVQGVVNQEIWKYQTITGIYIPEFCSWPKKVLKDTKLRNAEVKYQAIQSVCPNKPRTSFTKSDLMQIYEAAKIIDYEKVRKLVDADKQEIKKWIMKYTDGEYTSCIHFKELVDILEGKCETLS